MKTETESGFDFLELRMVDWALSIKLLSLLHTIIMIQIIKFIA